MSDRLYNDDFIMTRIAVRVGMACAVTVVAALGTFLAFHLLAG
jgi:hypothetical protein